MIILLKRFLSATLSIALILATLLFITACHSHDFGDWVTTKEPTCTKSGQRERSCTKKDCGELQIEDIAALGHSYVEGFCERCGIDENHVHTFGEWETLKKATCTDKGSKKRTCHSCGEIEIQRTEATGHSYDSGMCTECGAKEKHIHEFGEWVTKTEPTCTENGENERTCSTCGETEIEATDAKDHEMIDGICTTCGEEYTDGLEFTSNGDGTCYVSGIGSYSDTYLIIPPTSPEEERVVAISSYAFRGNSTLTCVEIPSSIKEIGHEAFRDCIRISKVFLGNGITKISGEAFRGCQSLKEIYIPSSILEIGNEAFHSCTNLKKVTIGGGASNTSLAYIESGAFSECSSLTSVLISNRIASIGDYAFNGCSVLSSLTMGQNVQYIGAKAFRYCNTLTSVIVPDSTTEIGHEAFRECERLQKVSFGKGLTKISGDAFRGCISLQKLNIPSNVITVGYDSFNGCTDLNSVTIGDNRDDIATITIESGAFNGCTALTSAFISDQVISIGDYAFNDCSALSSVTIGQNVQYIGAKAFRYCNALTSVVIPDSTTEIGHEAFRDCERLQKVSFGNGLTKISGDSFRGCISLYVLAIPSNVITIGYDSFKGCTALVDITIGDKADDIATITIESGAFDGCTALTSAFISNQVISIGDYAFNGCSALSSVTIGQKVQYIGAKAFRDCEALTSVIIPDSTIQIGHESFRNCKNMGSVTFGTGLLEIGGNAFHDCIRLTEVVIPSNVTTISQEAFRNCESLKKVTIGDGGENIPVTKIGSCVFENCTSLTEAIIGSNVKEIDDSAFKGCECLTIIKFGTGLNSIGSSIFANCTNLTSLVIPSNVLTINSRAFENCTNLETVTIEKGSESQREFGSNVFSDCSKLDRIYYTGTAEDWAKITISNYNDYPLNVTPYYYSETAPTSVGNYWYYNDRGEQIVWNVEETSFKAEQYSERFADSAFGNEETSYSSLLYKELESDVLLQAKIAIWENLHIATEGSWEEKLLSRTNVYEMAIYDLLMGQANAQSQINPFECIEKSCDTYFYEFAKFILGSDSLTKEELQKLKDALPDDNNTTYAEMVDKYFEGADAVLEIFKLASNVYDALYTCARYKAFSDMDTNFYLILTEIYNDDTLPWELRVAATESAACYGKAIETMLEDIVSLKLVDFTIKQLWDDFCEDAWKGLLKVIFPQVELVTIAAKGMMFLADITFNIDACNKAYYNLGAAVGLENALRKIIKNTLPDYLRSDCKGEAEYYMYATDMYKTSVLLGFDYANLLLTEHSKSIDIDKDEKAAYESTMIDISNKKQEKQELYDQFDALVSKHYTLYYS